MKKNVAMRKCQGRAAGGLVRIGEKMVFGDKELKRFHTDRKGDWSWKKAWGKHKIHLH